MMCGSGDEGRCHLLAICGIVRKREREVVFVGVRMCSLLVRVGFQFPLRSLCFGLLLHHVRGFIRPIDAPATLFRRICTLTSLHHCSHTSQFQQTFTDRRHCTAAAAAAALCAHLRISFRIVRPPAHWQRTVACARKRKHKAM